MNAEITKLIERYLQGELSAADRAVFEQRLTQSDQLLNEVVLQKRVHEAAKRSAQRAVVQQAAKSYHFRKQLTTAAVVVLVVTVLATVTWFVAAKNTGRETEGQSDAAFGRLIQKADKSAPLVGLPVEYFRLAQGDTVVLSAEGVLLSVPEGAFLLDGKPYVGAKVIQWQEALRASDIVKAGLSAVAGNRLLETQGMFGLVAYAPDGRELEINPKIGIYVQVPVDDFKSGMQLFEGSLLKNGQIDWINPQPMEKLPVMADMKDLDFYPPDYEPALDELKWRTGKKERDSLYLSFGDGDDEPFSYEVSESEITSGRATNAAQAVPWITSDSIGTYDATIAEMNLDGKQLFNAKCATCHSIHTDNTAPPLYDVRNKWKKGGAKESSIYLWVNNWIKAAKSDPFAAEVATMKPTEHLSFPNLKKNQIDAIFDYVDGFKRTAFSESAHIPPSKVLGFWNANFNRTILATHDFEKRMKSLHGTCSEAALDLYTNNLNKPLWTIDEQVAAMGYANFSEFANERVGAVKLDNPHMNNLRRFYASMTAKLKKEAKKNGASVRKQEAKWDNELARSRFSEGGRTVRREAKALAQETQLNYARVMQQLEGRAAGVTIRRRSPSNTYNCDRYTRLTVNRQTDTITDVVPGRRAVIVYNDFSVSVGKAGDYKKLMLYLFPHELSSYQRIDPLNGLFDYRLNDAITYDVAIVGINEDGFHIYEKTGFNKGALGTVALEKVSEAEFNSRIEALNSGRIAHPPKIIGELDWIGREQKNYKVQRLRKEQKAFRDRLRTKIFPCAGPQGGNQWEPEDPNQDIEI